MWTASLVALLALPPLQSPLDPPTLRVVCFGDSSTYQRRDTERAWPARLDDQLTAELAGCRVEVENAGRPGDTTSHALARLERDVLGRDPDLVLVQFGVNDAAVELPRGATAPAVSLADYRANLDALVERIEAGGAAVALLEPGAATWTPAIRAGYGRAPYRPDDPWGFDHLLAEYAAVVADLAATRGLPLVPVHQADRARGPEVTSRWRTDGRHPTDEAHAWLASEALEVVLAELESGALAPRPLSAHAAVSRGFTIPTRDLTGLPGARIDDPRRPALGPPALIATADGALLAAYTVEDAGVLRIAIRRSLDGGTTWSDGPAPTGAVAEGASVTLARAGDELLLWSDRRPVRLACSGDGGRSWGALAPAGPAGWGGQGLAAALHRRPDGTLVSWLFDDGRFLGAEGRFDGFELLQVEAPAAAGPWSAPARILRSDYAYFAHPCALELEGGPALLFAELSGQTNSWLMRTNDGGVTWGAPLEVAGALTGVAHRAARLPDGRLVVSFLDRALDTPTAGDGVAWVGVEADLLAGRQGARRARLFAGPGARPAVAVHGEDVLFAARVVGPDGPAVLARRCRAADL